MSEVLVTGRTSAALLLTVLVAAGCAAETEESAEDPCAGPVELEQEIYAKIKAGPEGTTAEERHNVLRQWTYTILDSPECFDVGRRVDARTLKDELGLQ